MRNIAIGVYIASILVLCVSILTRNINLLGTAEAMNFTSLFTIIYTHKCKRK